MLGVVTIIVLDLMFAIAAVQLVDLKELVSSATPQIAVAEAILGNIGVICCIWTLKDAWLGAGIATIAIALYAVIWCKVKKLAMFKPQPLDEALMVIKGRAEPYPEWDEAVDTYIASLK